MKTTFDQRDSELIAELVVQLREARKTLSINDLAQVVAQSLEDDLEIESLQKAISNITLN
jgi:hypothetical protein